ncbi:MAG: GyrI-like domain-containing protein [Myxococcales bacterium]|nr:GyrI-like domain-containing protein [Myxococcales bacterium]MDP3504089.1 GyrI-like domain-containing protein [Myxococcales bacterium]
MDRQCTIDEQPAQPTLCMKTRTSFSRIAEVLGQTFSDLITAVTAQGATVSGLPYVAYRNMNLSDLDLEIGVAVSRPLAALGRIEPGELPGGVWASTLHIGPYAGVGPAWNELHGYLRAQGKVAAPVGYEFYFDGPDTPPERTRTRVAFPLLPHDVATGPRFANSEGPRGGASTRHVRTRPIRYSLRPRVP